jgi:hypothetical protein
LLGLSLKLILATDQNLTILYHPEQRAVGFDWIDHPDYWHKSVITLL